MAKETYMNSMQQLLSEQILLTPGTFKHMKTYE